MKIHLNFLILLIVTALLTACSDPPIDRVIVTDATEFGKYNEYVTNTLAKEFEGVLPAQIPRHSIVNAFSYSYECAVLGNPNFYIHLQLTIEGTETYRSEQERISSISSSVLNDPNGKTYYLIHINADDIRHYTDTDVLDGMNYRFECAVFDEASQSIQYLSAQLWDYYKKVDSINEILTDIDALWIENK